MKDQKLFTCRSCGELVAVEVRKPNHALHAILSIVTAGLWLIIWLAAIFESSFSPVGKCPRCKGKV